MSRFIGGYGLQFCVLKSNGCRNTLVGVTEIMVMASALMGQIWLWKMFLYIFYKKAKKQYQKLTDWDDKEQKIKTLEEVITHLQRRNEIPGDGLDLRKSTSRQTGLSNPLYGYAPLGSLPTGTLNTVCEESAV